MDEFGFWPVFDHFSPKESAWFDDNFIFVILPDFCQFWKLDFFCSIIMKFLSEVIQLHRIKNWIYIVFQKSIKPGLLGTTTLSPSWIFEALVPVLVVVADVLDFPHDVRGRLANFWDTKLDCQDGNNGFENLGRRERQRPADAWFKPWFPRSKCNSKPTFITKWRKAFVNRLCSLFWKCYNHIFWISRIFFGHFLVDKFSVFNKSIKFRFWRIFRTKTRPKIALAATVNI